MNRYYTIWYSENESLPPIDSLEVYNDIGYDELIDMARDRYKKQRSLPSPCLIEVVEFKEVEGRLVSRVIHSETVKRGS